MEVFDVEKLCMGCLKPVPEVGGKCEHCGFDNSAPVYAHQLPPMTVLAGKYLTGRVLGEGGFGITYLGIDINLGMKVAIKEYYPAGFVTRTSETATVSPYSGTNGDYFTAGLDKFLAEARALARFHDLDGIVEVRDFFRENGTAYIIMEFIEGLTLSEALEKQGGRMSGEYAFALMEPVIISLINVHKAKIIHRDISPDNIMLDVNGRLKLLDFGAARQFDSKKTMSVMLKPGYAPIEQYQTSGDLGPWTDVYALCATIYKLITGSMPLESLERLVDDNLAPPSVLGADISPEREAVLMRGLAIKRGDRFSNMSALHTAFYKSSRSVSALPKAKEAPIATPSLALPDLTAPAEASAVSSREKPKPPKLPKINLRRLIIMLSGVLAVGCAIVLLLVVLSPANRRALFTQPTASKPPVAASQTVAPVFYGEGVLVPDIGLFAGVYGYTEETDEGEYHYYEMDSFEIESYLEYLQTFDWSDRKISIQQGDGADHYIINCDGYLAEVRVIESSLLQVFIPSETTVHFVPPAITQSYLSQNGLTASRWAALPEDYDFAGINYRGNSASNYRNGAIIARQGRRVYFCDVNTSGNIIAFDMDSESHFRLTDGLLGIMNISVAGEWLYFSAYSDDMIAERDIYRVRTDGSEPAQVIAGNAAGVELYGDWLYIADAQDGLYRIKAEESELQKTLSGNGLLMNIAYDRIFQSGMYGAAGIFSMDLDGEDVVRISEMDVNEMIVHGGWIYYITGDADGNMIGRMDIDGGQDMLLSKTAARGLSIADQRIYYVGRDDDALYSMSIDGTDGQQLATDCQQPFVISDESYIYLFYTDTTRRLMLYNFSDGSSMEFGLR